MYKEKGFRLFHSIEGYRVIIPKRVREKLSVWYGDFLAYLETWNGSVKIKKFEFDWNEAVKQIKKSKRQKLLKLTEPLFVSL
jgi:bifunctional DNA-binding transcriptional regulator/antitoxin component of YhaV-PrlF toxin-antitoxin module